MRLFNGAIGTIVHIVWSDEQSQVDARSQKGALPAYVVVEFPDNTGPGWNNVDHCVPVYPLERTCSGAEYASRMQVPLMPAYALQHVNVQVPGDVS